MKRYTHAWLSFKAIELLQNYTGQFNPNRNKSLESFLKFINNFPQTFVRGSWFPDNVISDNVQGGHTWKYKLDSSGKFETRRPPNHNLCFQAVGGHMNKKVSLNLPISDLPDRCEALGQMIRDTIKITNKLDRGDVAAFNDSQIAILFLIISHYIADAHVPVHCDNRDFNNPSKIHSDLEGHWEKEIKKHHKISYKNKQFDLNADNKLQRKSTLASYSSSLLKKVDDLIFNNNWSNLTSSSNNWRVFLGNNNNFWDYIVSVCHVNFFTSLDMFPITPPQGVNFNTVRILQNASLKTKVDQFSPLILADAINSIAIIWLASWERWELLDDGIR